MRKTSLQTALAFALLLGAAPATVSARAGETPALTAPQRKAIEKQEAKDRKVVEKALRVGSLGELAPMVPDLQKVLSNAPPRWPMIDRQPGLTTVRLNNPDQTLTVLLASAVQTEEVDGKPGQTVAVLNTYGMAAFLLGSRAVEMRQPEEALRWLDQGLAFQPENLLLITEKGSALILQHRFAETLAFYDASPQPDLLTRVADPYGEARILRSRGFCLTELNRLDEAETAYQQSLELEPDHGGAKAELGYIRKLKAGAAKQAVGVCTGSEAKARKD